MRGIVSLIVILVLASLTGVMAIRRVPCLQPISIGIGTVDPHFAVSRQELKEAALRAEKIWEDIEHRDLFTIADTGDVTINLVYDKRQQAEEQLQQLGQSISSAMEQHDKLDRLYTDARQVFDDANDLYNEHRETFIQHNDAYTKHLDAVQGNANATQADYDAVNTERATLQKELDALKKEQVKVESLRTRVNALVDEEHQLVPDINKNIENYSDVAGSRGDEFETGVYHSGADGQNINIYIYTDKDQLARLLTHEMGHAVGLLHVEDPQAIMYRLNESKKLQTTDADVQAIHQLCRWADVKGWPQLIWERIGGLFH